MILILLSFLWNVHAASPSTSDSSFDPEISKAECKNCHGLTWTEKCKGGAFRLVEDTRLRPVTTSRYDLEAESIRRTIRSTTLREIKPELKKLTLLISNAKKAVKEFATLNDHISHRTLEYIRVRGLLETQLSRMTEIQEQLIAQARDPEVYQHEEYYDALTEEWLEQTDGTAREPQLTRNLAIITSGNQFDPENIRITARFQPFVEASRKAAAAKIQIAEMDVEDLAQTVTTFAATADLSQVFEEFLSKLKEIETALDRFSIRITQGQISRIYCFAQLGIAGVELIRILAATDERATEANETLRMSATLNPELAKARHKRSSERIKACEMFIRAAESAVRFLHRLYVPEFAPKGAASDDGLEGSVEEFFDALDY